MLNKSLLQNLRAKSCLFLSTVLSAGNCVKCPLKFHTINFNLDFGNCNGNSNRNCSCSSNFNGNSNLLGISHKFNDFSLLHFYENANLLFAFAFTELSQKFVSKVVCRNLFVLWPEHRNH